jgi:PST family polysaccharide transporter
MFVTQSINACAIVFSFAVGLPFGPVGVAMAFSVSTLLVRIPIYYYSAGRDGPVRTADLWSVFFRHLPVWIVVFSATSLALDLAARFTPLLQLLICVPAGLIAGGAMISCFTSQRQVATHLLDTLRELKKNR